MNKTSGISLTIVGLLIGALSVITPILWDWWNKRSEITIEIKQSFTVLQKEKSIQKLEISYGNKPITSLNKTILVLKNTGRTPITKDDVISPANIRFKDANLLEVTLTKQSPPNINANISYDNQNITLNFLLLNPDDELELSILTAEGSPNFVADARIKNINQIAVMDLNRQNKIKWNVGIGPYFAGIFGLMFIFTGIFVFIESFPKKISAKALLTYKAGPLVAAVNIKDVENYLATSLNFLSDKNKTPIIDVLKTIKEPISLNDKEQIIEVILRSINEEELGVIALIAFVLGGVGVWYAAKNFLVFLN